MLKQLSILFITLAALFGCRQAACRSVSADEFATFIAAPGVQRLDVRTFAEYSEGHIPASININVMDEKHFTQFSDSLLDKARPVALYCRSGRRSKKAATILSGMGYQVVELDGGFNDWTKAGQEIER